MENIVTFQFPIKDPGGVAQMHYIPPFVLPNFHGLENEYPNTFLFEFEVLVEDMIIILMLKSSKCFLLL